LLLRATSTRAAAYPVAGFELHIEEDGLGLRCERENGSEGEDLWEKDLVLGRKVGVEVEKT